MEKINWKSIVVSLSVALIGVLLILWDIFGVKTVSHVWISIGCSLIASGMVIFLSALFFRSDIVIKMPMKLITGIVFLSFEK